MEVGAKQAKKGRLLQEENLSMSGGRSKGSGKEKVAPSGEFDGKRK